MSAQALRRGCDFLVSATEAEEIFTPEDFTDERKRIAATTARIVNDEVLPGWDELEKPDFGPVAELLRKSGGPGLFLSDAPQKYGGLELDKATGMLVAEKIAPAGALGAAYLATTGAGSFPLIYFGTDRQKERYLAKLTTGAWLAAFCLTEPGSGVEAPGVRSLAVLSKDGRHYVLNGGKQSLACGGSADLLTVFAEVDGEKCTGFLMERSFAGLSFAAEEKKPGSKGSSAVRVVMDNVQVPVENVLGEIGQGHEIACRVLTLGRLKLGALVAGMAKFALAEGLKEANEGKPYGGSVASFGAVREKIADMKADIFASASVVYRLAGLIDAKLSTIDRDTGNYYQAYLEGIEEYAAECAIAKVFCSDVLSRVTAEVLRLPGGDGVIGDYPAERLYRDQRIRRMYAAGDETDRLVIPRVMLKKSAQSEAIKQSLSTLQGYLEGHANDTSTFAGEKALLTGLKTFFQSLNFVAAEKFGDDLSREQEILVGMADVAINIFAIESCQLRAEKIHPALSEKRQALVVATVKVFTANAVEDAVRAAKRASYFVAEGEMLVMLLNGIRCLAEYDATGLLRAKRLLADAASEAEG